MKKRYRLSANYIKEHLRDYSGGDIAYCCGVYKNGDPSFDEDLFRRYIRGECGPNGGKIKKKRSKHMTYDGLDLSEMVEE